MILSIINGDYFYLSNQWWSDILRQWYRELKMALLTIITFGLPRVNFINDFQ